MERVPPVETIASALAPTPSGGGICGSVAAGIAAIAGILPSVTCPACWPVYAGLLGSLGLGFLMQRTYLLPLAAGLVLLAIVSLGISARKRHGYAPFWLAAIGGVVMLLGKFVLAEDAAVYGGVGLLIVASLWNAWPAPRRGRAPCTNCCSEGGGRVRCNRA